MNAGGAQFLLLYYKNKYGGSDTVEPRYSEGPTDWQKFVPYNENSLSVRFFFIYFTIAGVNKIVRYTQDFVVQKFFRPRDSTVV